MIYIAECFTFNRAVDLETFNVERERNKIVDVLLTLLNFEWLTYYFLRQTSLNFSLSYNIELKYSSLPIPWTSETIFTGFLSRDSLSCF